MALLRRSECGHEQGRQEPHALGFRVWDVLKAYRFLANVDP